MVKALRNTIRFLDWITDMAVIIVLILILLLGLYSLYDAYKIYDKASDNSNLLKYKPKTVSSGPERAGWDELISTNPDTQAWLTIDGTNIDYPVVQGSDNVYYVNHDFYGEYSLSGSIFLDTYNNPGFIDDYNLIYGHHLEHSIMFGQLDSFLEETYFKEHSNGMLYLQDENCPVKIFAILRTNAYNWSVYPEDTSEVPREDILKVLRENAEIYVEPELTDNTRIIGMSTCAEETTNGRILLYGVFERHNTETGTAQDAVSEQGDLHD